MTELTPFSKRLHFFREILFVLFVLDVCIYLKDFKGLSSIWIFGMSYLMLCDTIRYDEKYAS